MSDLTQASLSALLVNSGRQLVLLRKILAELQRVKTPEPPTPEQDWEPLLRMKR